MPERLTLRFDRRLTVGESAEQALPDVESLEAVRQARAAGLRVEIGVPHYRARTWRVWRTWTCVRSSTRRPCSRGSPARW